MLRPRVIPCLLVHNKGLVKTVKFKSPKYVGDPLNAVKIFNEKQADELIVLDIDASAKNAEPDYALIEKLANQSRMPLCYGGGIKKVEQALKILSLGIEKVALSSGAIENPNLVNEISKRTGSQSVVVVLDVKKKLFGGSYDVCTHNGSKKSKESLLDFALKMENAGAGEIVLNSIDNDGVMKGFDLKLIELVKSKLSIPLTVLGGAGSLSDIRTVIEKFGIIGVAAGSLFVFKGVYKAVLINYPSPVDKAKVLG